MSDAEKRLAAVRAAKERKLAMESEKRLRKDAKAAAKAAAAKAATTVGPHPAAADGDHG